MKLLGLPLLSAGVGLVLCACGGEDKGPRPEANLCRPILPVSDSLDTGGGAPDCHALDGYELYLIDDFENPSRTGWYVNNDRTALQVPAPDEDPPRTSEIPGGRCAGSSSTERAPTYCDSPTTPRGECQTAVDLTSRRAMHVQSGLLSRDGGQLGRNLSKDCSAASACKFAPGPPEIGPCSTGLGPSPAIAGCRANDDLSDWDGIVAWIRVAPGSSSSIRVRAADGATDDKGCVCNPYTNQNDSSTGCDKWGKYFNVDNTFRAYLVPFAEMQQGGWGLKSPFLDQSNLFSIGIEWRIGAWDLWIDDVAYYRRRP
jgi:hypothetical protein